ncbi:unnamed protein product [Gulo gulo]|nr:unnamed protein product [Gulo gulo]
MLNTTPY